MINKNPFIHLLKTRGGYYLYDVNKNVIISIGKDVYDFLDKTPNKNSQQGIFEAVEKMKSKGYLSSKRVSEIIHPMDEVLMYYLNNKMKMIILQVTRQCNLRCEYCVYSGNYENRSHSSERMSSEIAKKGIDFLIDHSRDSRNVAIAFYGGEPLLEFELIRECVEYAEEKFEGKKVLFTFTTNGTLLYDNVLEYVRQHNFHIVISLDGPGEVHNKNRKFASDCRGSFDKVMKNLENIRDKYPDIFSKLSLHAVVDRRNDFGCINNFFSNDKVVKDTKFTLSFVSEYYLKKAISTSHDFHKKIIYEYFKLFLSKLGRLDEKYVSKLALPYYLEMEKRYKQLVPVKELNDKMHHGGPCIPGAQRLFINVEGELFPCERVNETSKLMRIGDLVNGFDMEKVRNILNIGSITEGNCKECWAIRFCGLCAAAADDSTELSDTKKLSHCKNVKNTIDSIFKDICALKEKGFDFESTDLKIV